MPDDARRRPCLLFHHRQVIRIAAATAAAFFAAGYIVNESARDAELLTWLARASVSVAALALYSSIIEVRLARQMARADARTQERFARIEKRLDSRLHDAEFAEGYVRGLQRRPPDDDGGPFLRAV